MHVLRTVARLVPLASLVVMATTAAAGEPAAPSSREATAASTQRADRPMADAGTKAKAKPKAVPKRQVGKASFYGREFFGRKMANGRRMDPNNDNAASRTLPLGTKALVTNLDTGKSAVVTIEDRGPYVDGRIVDLSPATAEKIGLERKQGLAPVEVVPLDVAPPATSTETASR